MTRSTLLAMVATVIWLVAPGIGLAMPIKLTPVRVEASASLTGSSPSNVADGNPGTEWNSGGFGPQWIQLDFGAPVALHKLRFLALQVPAGPTTHVLTVGDDPANLRVVRTFKGTTADGQWLEHQESAPSDDHLGSARYVRITTTKSPSWVAWREIEVYQGVEYVGPFASAFDGHGTGDYTNEIAQAGYNLTWIRANDFAGLKSKLEVARKVGVKAILVLDSFFPRPNPHDWPAQWPAVRNMIRTGGYESTIAAFYPIDEPYTGVAPGEWADLRDSLARIANLIHIDFPDIPVAVVLSFLEVGYYGLTPDMVAPFDWVGFDCYGDWNSCNGLPMTTYISKLRSLLSPSQRMLAVPEAFKRSDKDLLPSINAWHKEILSDGKYVAVAPFLWPTVTILPDLDPGARDIPTVKERLTQLSRSLLHADGDLVFPVSVTASGSWGGYEPFGALDRDNNTSWNAGGFPEQWIELDLGGYTKVARITLRTLLSPGTTGTQVLEGINASSGAYKILGTLTGTEDNQVLTWTAGAPVDIRSLRVRTAAGTSWVAWREISLFR